MQNQELAEQQTVLEWAQWQRGKYPELDLLYHIPNEGKRSAANGAVLKRAGLKKGVPDLCLPVAKASRAGNSANGLKSSMQQAILRLSAILLMKRFKPLKSI